MSASRPISGASVSRRQPCCRSGCASTSAVAATTRVWPLPIRHSPRRASQDAVTDSRRAPGLRSRASMASCRTRESQTNVVERPLPAVGAQMSPENGGNKLGVRDNKPRSARARESPAAGCGAELELELAGPDAEEEEDEGRSCTRRRRGRRLCQGSRPLRQGPKNSSQFLAGPGGDWLRARASLPPVA
jgi:hypothetical protein